MKTSIKTTGHRIESSAPRTRQWLTAFALIPLLFSVILTAGNSVSAAESDDEPKKLSPEEILYEQAMEAARLQDFLGP
jgi:hypothetical protein